MKTKNKAFVKPVKENSQKEKTKHIKFDCLERSEHLKENKKTQLSKIIFSLRSGILDIKKWNNWKHQDNLCVIVTLKKKTSHIYWSAQNMAVKTLKLGIFTYKIQTTSSPLQKK